jgi:putative NADH-flavin reductase
MRCPWLWQSVPDSASPSLSESFLRHGTGRELVQQALELGHEVTAFTRHAQALGIAHERLRIVEGDALRRVSVDAAIKGQSAVLSALGTRSLFKHITLFCQSAECIVGSMERQGVQR